MPESASFENVVSRFSFSLYVFSFSLVPILPYHTEVKLVLLSLTLKLSLATKLCSEFVTVRCACELVQTLTIAD